MTNKKDEAAVALGKKGGNKTLEKYGKSHYSDMGKKRWENKKNKNKDDDLTK